MKTLLPFGTATITSKGQLTVPVGIRRRLRLRRGQRLAVTALDQDTVRFTLLPAVKTGRRERKEAVGR